MSIYHLLCKSNQIVELLISEDKTNENLITSESQILNKKLR